MNEPDAITCPCGSGRTYADCCGPLLEGARPAATAEALMRSRYTAYTRGDAAYVARTWHASSCPAELDLNRSPVHWTGLTVIGCTAGGADDDRGTVEFIAHFEADGRAGQVHEVSRFVREHGQWLYLDGEAGRAPAQRPHDTGRNAPCPCGSGKKFKRCCGRDR